MYGRLVRTIDADTRGRVRSMIGSKPYIKYKWYKMARLTISLSAHSTLGISLMTGTPVVDIITKKLLKEYLKTTIYPWARNTNPNGLAFIEIDESSDICSIISHIKQCMSDLMADQKEYLNRNSITNFIQYKD